MQMKLLGITSAYLDQLLTMYSAFIRYWGHNWSIIGQCNCCLQILRMPMKQ